MNNEIKELLEKIKQAKDVLNTCIAQAAEMHLPVKIDVYSQRIKNGSCQLLSFTPNLF